MKVLVGTASWSDKSLIASKQVLPARREQPEARLRYYATQFPLVEVDTSLLRDPARRQTAQALGRAHAGPLHAEREGVPALHRPRDVGQGAAARPARRAAARRQAELLLQGRSGRAARRALAALQGGARAAAGGRQARHGALPVRALADAQPRRPRPCRALRRAMAGLHGERRVPQQDLVRRRPPRRDARLRARARTSCTPSSTGRRASTTACRRSGNRPTSDYALVRLHGRNHETWNIKGATVASERFNYDYPDAELERHRRHGRAARARDVHDPRRS